MRFLGVAGYYQKFCKKFFFYVNSINLSLKWQQLIRLE